MGNQKYKIEDIYKLLREEIGVNQLNPQSDIFGELGVSGDDFHD